MQEYCVCCGSHLRAQDKEELGAHVVDTPDDLNAGPVNGRPAEIDQDNQGRKDAPTAQNGKRVPGKEFDKQPAAAP